MAVMFIFCPGCDMISQGQFPEGPERSPLEIYPVFPVTSKGIKAEQWSESDGLVTEIKKNISFTLQIKHNNV